MAKPFKIEIKGLDKLQKKIDKLPRDLTDETDGYIQKICVKAVKEAYDKAPKDTGKLKQTIYFTGAKLAYVIFANTRYAPFQEFGTGTGMKIDPRVSSYASQFRGGNKRKTNIPARQFFFSSIFKQEENIEREYSKLLDKVLSK